MLRPSRELARELGSGQTCGTRGSVFKVGGELVGIAGGREAGVAGANESERLVGWEVRKSLLEGAGERGELRAGGDAEDGFSEAEDAVSGFFEGLSVWVACRTGNDDLNWMVGEKRGSEAVSGGEEAVLRGDSSKSF